jgi:hypothetical protein
VVGSNLPQKRTSNPRVFLKPRSIQGREARLRRLRRRLNLANPAGSCGAWRAPQGLVQSNLRPAAAELSQWFARPKHRPSTIRNILLIFGTINLWHHSSRSLQFRTTIALTRISAMDGLVQLATLEQVVEATDTVPAIAIGFEHEMVLAVVARVAMVFA